MLDTEELGSRVARCLAEENRGMQYRRVESIKLRVLERHMSEALAPMPRCSFTNQYGFCLEPVGHVSKHRCVFLGDD